MKWQLTDLPSSRVSYYDPQTFQCVIQNGRLHNVPSVAKKIFAGENKDVCSWISFENMSEVVDSMPEDVVELSYNPKSAPHWIARGYDGANLDGFCGDIFIRARTLYTSRTEVETFLL